MKLSFTRSALSRFRIVALAEGTSFILLLGAMPFKHFYDMPAGVKYIGWLHGLLFILYVLALLLVKIRNQWSIRKSFIAFVASLIPFGTFVLDKSLQKEENEIDRHQD
jgi:integral membrane protein